MQENEKKKKISRDREMRSRRLIILWICVNINNFAMEPRGRKMTLLILFSISHLFQKLRCDQNHTLLHANYGCK